MVVFLARLHHQNGNSSGSMSSGTSLPVAFHPTILNVGFDLRPYRVIIGAVSSATIGIALGCAMRMRAIASPRLITASRPPQLDVEKVNASAVSGSTKYTNLVFRHGSRALSGPPSHCASSSSPSSSRSGIFVPGARIRYSTGLPFRHSDYAAAVPIATSWVPRLIGSVSLPRVQFESANLSRLPRRTRSFASAAASVQPSSLMVVIKSFVMSVTSLCDDRGLPPMKAARAVATSCAPQFRSALGEPADGGGRKSSRSPSAQHDSVRDGISRARSQVRQFVCCRSPAVRADAGGVAARGALHELRADLNLKSSSHDFLPRRTALAFRVGAGRSSTPDAANKSGRHPAAGEGARRASNSSHACLRRSAEIFRNWGMARPSLAWSSCRPEVLVIFAG